MRKKLLLLCALFTAATGTWAQNNVVSGKTPTVIQSPIDPVNLTNITDGVTTGDENTASAAFANDADTNNKVSAKAVLFYFDLGESKELSNITIYWTAANANVYDVYVANEAPTDVASLSSLSPVVSEEDDTKNLSGKQSYNIEATGQYVIFYATKAYNDWGCKIYEFEVYDSSPVTLGSFTVSPAFVIAETATSLTASAFDNANNTYTNVKYQIDGENADLSETQTLSEGAHTITAIDTNNGEITLQKTIYAVTSAPAAKTGSKHVAIYTSDVTPTWTAEGGSVLGDDITFSDGGKAKIVNLKQVNLSAPAEADAVKNYNRATVAIFPVTDMATGAAVVNPGNLFKNFQEYQTGGLKAGEWNVVDFEISPSSESEDVISAFRVHNDTGNAIDVLIANVVVYYKDPNAFELTTTDGVATITGAVTASDVDDINTADAMVIDLTGVTTIDEVTIEPKHKNALIKITNGGTATGEKFENIADTKNLVYKTGDYIYPVAKLQFTDEAGEEFWNGEDSDAKFLETSTTGYQITRSIDADKWVTAYIPAETAIPTGISAYTVDEENTSTTQITFKKITGTTLAANTAYVLHNTTEEAINLVVDGTGYLYLEGEKDAVAIGETSVSSVGTIQTIKCDGSQYALSGGELKQIINGNIGAFRVYFTGLTSTGARAIFNDGDETTAIGTIKANGEVDIQSADIYNLNGQRVARPAKGVYIVNGKKVIFK